MIGEPLLLKIRVSNPGSGAASGVVLTENVPSELKHEAGQELEVEIGTLKPGESRELELSLTAAQAGHAVNLLTARGEANLRIEDRTELDVLAPALKLASPVPKSATWSATPPSTSRLATPARPRPAISSWSPHCPRE